MSMSSPHEIYVRHTDKDGASIVAEHRVWDADRFMAARHVEATKAGGKAKSEQLTREQFLSEKK